jgi:hypothetical protein
MSLPKAFAKAGCVIGDNRYGYRSGYVATLKVNPSRAVMDAVDFAGAFMGNLVDRVNKEHDHRSSCHLI